MGGISINADQVIACGFLLVLGVVGAWLIWDVLFAKHEPEVIVETWTHGPCEVCKREKAKRG
jgi:hypothetical protein